MNKFILMFLVFSGSLWGLECRPDRIVIEADYWGVWRKDLKKLNMVTPNEPSLSKISMGYRSGLRGRAEIGGWYQSLEFRFAGLLKWNKSQEVINGAGMAISTDPFVTSDWVNFPTLFYNYKSTFNSFEGSYFYHLTPRRVDYFSFAVNIGPRVIDFHDKILFQNELSDLTVKCKNLPIGGQIGMDFEGNPTPQITWKIDARVGVYGNLIKKRVIVYDETNTVLAGDATYKRTQIAYTTDIIPSMIFRAGPLALTAGYEFFGLYNVAFAPNQVKITRPLSVMGDRKNLILQAVVLGGSLSY